MSAIDEYLQNVTSSQKDELERIRNVVKELIPEAEETLSYGMPTFKYHNQLLISFAAFKHHLSIFPTSDAMVEALGEELGKHRTSTGTLQFTETNPLSDSLLKRVINFRRQEIDRAIREER